MIHLHHPGKIRPSAFVMLIALTAGGFFVQQYREVHSETSLTANDVRQILDTCGGRAHLDESCFFSYAAELSRSDSEEETQLCTLYAGIAAHGDGDDALRDAYLATQDTCMQEIDTRVELANLMDQADAVDFQGSDAPPAPPVVEPIVVPPPPEPVVTEPEPPIEEPTAEETTEPEATEPDETVSESVQELEPETVTEEPAQPEDPAIEEPTEEQLDDSSSDGAVSEPAPEPEPEPASEPVTSHDESVIEQ